MTPSDFKAWFEGFREGMDGPPSAKQWDRIIARVAEVDGRPVTATVFVDRYWPLYPRSPYNDMYRPWQYAQGFHNQCGGNAQQYTLQGWQNTNMAAQDYVSHAQESAHGFDSEAAMRELGRKDRSDIN